MKRIQTIYYTGNLSKFQELEAQGALHAVDYATLIEVVRSNSQQTSKQMAERIGVTADELQPVLNRLHELELINLQVETIKGEI
ncbi:MAG: hypothetical protein ABF723_04045 [Lentilactobacillus hilgardii]|uniref:hypothetical protein n=1 Tax=Lactobacillaceae TaxID=33958 RepID=UPI001CC1D0E1|nr:hypothetical protein [Lentilactobacillus hilgardii]MBZ2200231.1 hypothetical protein [Lentilactobacillus hilgardii]MBZ2203355.1 hypothetical protein [Lentilactobacillus hilgardii]